MPAIESITEAGNPTKVIVTTRPCTMCGKQTTMRLDRDAVMRWLNGELIQRVWPDMPAAQREVLMSGIDGECFARL